MFGKMGRGGLIAGAKKRAANSKPDPQNNNGPSWRNGAVSHPTGTGAISGAHSRVRASRPETVDPDGARRTQGSHGAPGTGGGNAPKVKAAAARVATGRGTPSPNTNNGPTITGRRMQSASTAPMRRTQAAASAGKGAPVNSNDNGPIRAAKGGKVHAMGGGLTGMMRVAPRAAPMPARGVGRMMPGRMMASRGISSAPGGMGFAPRFNSTPAAKGGVMAPGGGGRFAAMVGKLKGKVEDPKAVAAAIGRKKYGAKGMAKMAAAGRRRSESAG